VSTALKAALKCGAVEAFGKDHVALKVLSHRQDKNRQLTWAKGKIQQPVNTLMRATTYQMCPAAVLSFGADHHCCWHQGGLQDRHHD